MSSCRLYTDCTSLLAQNDSNLQWQEQNRPVLHKSDGNFMFKLVFLYRVKHFHTHILINESNILLIHSLPLTE